MVTEQRSNVEHVLITVHGRKSTEIKNTRDRSTQC